MGGFTRAASLPVAPNGSMGQLIGLVHRVPIALKKQYTYMREVQHWSDFTIILGVLAVPVIAGMCVCGGGQVGVGAGGGGAVYVWV